MVTGLFPSHLPVPRTPYVWDRAHEITVEELTQAVKRVGKENKAPDPDGILEKMMAETAGVLWASCFSACLRKDYFPSEWKRAQLVLQEEG